MPERARRVGVLPPAPSLSEAQVTGQKAPALIKMYPGWGDVEHRESQMVGLPASAASYFAKGIPVGGKNFGSLSGAENAVSNLGLSSTEKNTRSRIMSLLPLERNARYAILHTMALDPTIHCALQMHIANALAPKHDTGESVIIKSVDDKPNKIVDDLCDVLNPIIAKQLNEWAWKAAIFGTCFSRVYGRPKVGIEAVRTDYYTHPRYVQKFSKAGRLAGYTTNYQATRQSHEGIRLLPPWYFVSFEIPEYWDNEVSEPVNVMGNAVDLAMEDYELEGLVESQEYGMSLLAPAYAPWLDLLDAVCSMRMSRRNAARLERIIGVNIGKLDPERAARYLSMIAERITNSSAELEKQSWLEGHVQTVVNHIIPNSTEKGSMQIDAVQGTPDINGLEDVLFHIKRLGAALGVDPAMLGFGDLLSGGLGDGGFFRVSIQAASKAQFLQAAIKNGLDQLCELHIAYKYGKYFTPKERPWKIEFAAMNTAIAREAQENLESRVNAMGAVIGTFATIDQEFSIADKRELASFIWTSLQLDDEKFDKVFPEGKEEENEQKQLEQQQQLMDNNNDGDTENNTPPIEEFKNKTPRVEDNGEDNE